LFVNLLPTRAARYRRVTAENEQLFDATFIYFRCELSDVDCFELRGT
jgi:hypothetical protein